MVEEAFRSLNLILHNENSRIDNVTQVKVHRYNQGKVFEIKVHTAVTVIYLYISISHELS